MFIVNEHGILHGWPDEWAIPTGSREATIYEIGIFQTTGEQVIANMPPPETHPTQLKDAKPVKKAT